MEDPAKVILGISLFASVAYSIRAIADAAVRHKMSGRKTGSLDSADERLARIEHAVDAIALEVERISEAQRFTTKLLSDRSRSAEKHPS